MAGKGIFFEKKELSLSILDSLFLPGLQSAVISKMMGRTELMLCEGMFPSRFPIVNVFQAKNGRKGNFPWKKKELSLSNLRSLVLPGLQGALISKMMGHTELKVLEAMFTGRSPTVRVFKAKNGRKMNLLS